MPERAETGPCTVVTRTHDGAAPAADQDVSVSGVGAHGTTHVLDRDFTIAGRGIDFTGSSGNAHATISTPRHEFGMGASHGDIAIP